MENLFFIVVLILGLLAISDLIVGVSNDAVNFLNSAIGSKAAPYKIIMLVAALGILAGTTFSNGMMEVARKGIFNPVMFNFSDVMFIFLAVMITDVILLDLFNTFGLPTSTTVSLIFELLGASVGIAFIKISHNHIEGATIIDYINSEKALTMIFGILISVVISFSVGAIVQVITRLIFTFNYKKTYKYFGAIFGGFAITAIVYFILIKGARGSSIISAENAEWIKQNRLQILIYGFMAWSLLLELLILLFKINVFKVIVLVGTFALAMAFAGNDLVNFVGVPLAGFESFNIFKASGAVNPFDFLMGGLNKEIRTGTIYLLIAGAIMVLTLWFSKKAKSVTKTSIDLCSQDENDERFGSSLIARVLVREGIRFGRMINSITPKPIAKTLTGRFEKIQEKKKKEKVAFDLVRASVNLVVASILIAFGTSHKLPLSTTYVTFMVAMGTSLADGAWNRESAVYRITGVFTVIGGWFLTAFVAFSTAFIIAYIIYWGEGIAIVAFISIAVFIVVKTHAFHKKGIKEKETEAKEDVVVNAFTIIAKGKKELVGFLENASGSLLDINNSLIKDKRRPLIKIKNDLKLKENKYLKRKKKAHRNIFMLNETDLDSGYVYLSILDHMDQVFDNIKIIWKLAFEHVNNNHTPLPGPVKNDLDQLNDYIQDFSRKLVKAIDKHEKDLKGIENLKDNLSGEIEKLQKKIVKQIKNTNISAKTSIMLQSVLTELDQFVNNSYKLAEIQRKNL